MGDRGVVLDSGLKLCVMLQQGNSEGVKALLPNFHAELEAAEADVFFATLKNVLSTTIRKREEVLFAQILEQEQKHLVALLLQEEGAALAREFIDFIVFTVCDRRLTSMFPVVKYLVESYTRNLNDVKLLLFWNEWTSLIVRLARRKWQAETDWLLQVLLHQLWRKQDVKLYQKIIWQLQMHVAMYSRFDNIEGMLKLYNRLFISFAIMIDFAGKHYAKEAKRAAWLQATLRSLSEMVVQLARGQMLEEQEIYQELYKQLVEANADINSKRQYKWLLMLQLSIYYWGLNHPKGLRRQGEYLENILAPDYVNDEYRELVTKSISAV